MNWKPSQLFWKLQSQPFSNCVLRHVPRSFIEGNMSSLPKTLGKLCTVSPLRLHSSIGEAFWSLAVEIFDYLSLSHCFLNLFNHRLAFFFFFGRELLFTSHWLLYFYGTQFWIYCPNLYFFLWNMGPKILPSNRYCVHSAVSIIFFFHTNFLKFAPMSYRVIDLSGQVSEGRNNGRWMGGTVGRKRALNSEKSEFTSWLRLMA